MKLAPSAFVLFLPPSTRIYCRYSLTAPLNSGLFSTQLLYQTTYSLDLPVCLPRHTQMTRVEGRTGNHDIFVLQLMNTLLSRFWNSRASWAAACSKTRSRPVRLPRFLIMLGRKQPLHTLATAVLTCLGLFTLWKSRSNVWVVLPTPYPRSPPMYSGVIIMVWGVFGSTALAAAHRAGRSAAAVFGCSCVGGSCLLPSSLKSWISG